MENEFNIEMSKVTVKAYRLRMTFSLNLKYNDTDKQNIFFIVKKRSFHQKNTRTKDPFLRFHLCLFNEFAIESTSFRLRTIV